MSLTPLVEIHSLSFHYPDGTPALDGVSLQVEEGEKIALVGANGAGKSTLLLHLNGILGGQGEVCIAGLPLIPANLGRVRALVGLIFQNPDDQLFSPTVHDDVAYGPYYQGLARDETSRRVEEALAAVGMQGFGPRNPYHLSAGEKKRVAIATVLAMRPQILAFDEPTAGLDPRARRELVDLLESLPQTMLIATHDLPLAARLASRTVVMQRGRITASGPSRQILADESLLLENGLA